MIYIIYAIMDEVTKYKKIYYICGKCGLSDFALRGHWHNI